MHLFLCATAGALEISSAEVEGAFLPEYTRNFYYSWAMAVSGSLELNNYFAFSGGLSLGRVKTDWETGTFIAAAYELPFLKPWFPLGVKMAYLFNNVFEVSTHTLVPSLSFQWNYAGFSLGPAMRFTVFDAGKPLHEFILAYSVYVCPINTESINIKLFLANVSDFAVQNRGAYSGYLSNRFRINKRMFVTSELEVWFSGNVSDITSIYGIAFKEGIVFTW
jgi:hypothetical protein